MHCKSILSVFLCAATLTACHVGVTTHHDHDEHEHEHEAAEGGAHSGEIVMSPEKAAAAGVATEKVSLSEFHGVIPASGEILPATGSEATVVAPASGVVTFVRPLAEGSTVGGGEALFYITSGHLQDGDPIEKARVAYESAKAEFDRVSALVEDKIVSSREYNAAKSQYETARLSYESLSGEKSSKGVSVKTPLGGNISALLVNQGEYVEVGKPLASVMKGGKLYLRVDVPKRYSRDLASVTSARFRTSYDEKVYDTQALSGRIASKGIATGAESAYIPMTFELSNDGTILSGSFADVWLLTAAQSSAISIPVEAVTEEQSVKFVYVQLDEDCYLKREVKLGSSDGQRVQVLSGLGEGETVVTKGAVHVKLAGAANIIPAHTHNH